MTLVQAFGKLSGFLTVNNQIQAVRSVDLFSDLASGCSMTTVSSHGALRVHPHILQTNGSLNVDFCYLNAAFWLDL